MCTFNRLMELIEELRVRPSDTRIVLGDLRIIQEEILEVRDALLQMPVPDAVPHGHNMIETSTHGLTLLEQAVGLARQYALNRNEKLAQRAGELAEHGLSLLLGVQADAHLQSEDIVMAEQPVAELEMSNWVTSARRGLR